MGVRSSNTSKILWNPYCGYAFDPWTATLSPKKPLGIAIWFSLTTSLQTWIGLGGLRRRRRKGPQPAASTRSSSSTTQTSVAQAREVRIHWGSDRLGMEKEPSKYMETFRSLMIPNVLWQKMWVLVLGEMFENRKWFFDPHPSTSVFDKCWGATAVTRITICKLPTYSECVNDMFIKNQHDILRVESWTSNGLTLNADPEVALAEKSTCESVHCQYVAGRWTR